MNSPHEEARIRSLIDTWVEATLTRDVPRVTALYVSDVVSFDAIGPLQVRGLEAWTAHWQACMERACSRLR